MVWPFASNVPVGCPKDPSFISPCSEREREGEREKREREREREREKEREVTRQQTYKSSVDTPMAYAVVDRRQLKY